MVFFSALLPYEEWDKAFKIYLGGTIFVVYAAKIFPILTLIIDDVRRFFQLIIRKVRQLSTKNDLPAGRKISRSKFLGNLGLITGGIALSGLVTGMIKWAYDFKVRKSVITLENLPKAFNGLRIIQISDLHLGSWTSRSKLMDVVETMNEYNPDLVFFTGDLVDYVSSEAFEFEDILRKIRSRYGVFAVLGNHDYGAYAVWDSVEDKRENMEDLLKFFKDIGWNLLNNENHIIARGEERISVIGIENWSSYDRFPRYGDLDRALKGTEESDVKLLLSHDPTFWDQKVQKAYSEIDVTFSGHTHGLQFGIDLPNFKWSPAQYLYKQWAGLYSSVNTNRNKQYLYVNRGTGTIGYPGRIGILPEITLIELENFSG